MCREGVCCVSAMRGARCNVWAVAVMAVAVTAAVKVTVAVAAALTGTVNVSVAAAGTGTVKVKVVGPPQSNLPLSLRPSHRYRSLIPYGAEPSAEGTATWFEGGAEDDWNSPRSDDEGAGAAAANVDEADVDDNSPAADEGAGAAADTGESDVTDGDHAAAAAGRGRGRVGGRGRRLTKEPVG